MKHLDSRHGTPIRNTYLFLDYRHIQCGQLEWIDAQGKVVRLKHPPEPPGELTSSPVGIAGGIALRMEPAEKTAPMDIGGFQHKVIYEGGVYRSWGRVGNYLCYRQSKDGYEWTAPDLNIIDVDDVKPNNVVFAPQLVPGQTGLDGFGLMVDEHAPAPERYKLVYMATPPEADRDELAKWFTHMHPRHRDMRLETNPITGLYAAVSPDGLKWTPLPEPILPHYSDTLTTLYFDDWLGRYVMYTRQFIDNRRWIGRAETEDFRKWQTVEPMIGPSLDMPSYCDWYTNGRTTYPDEPGYHLMFPMCYNRADESSEAYFYSSADGIYWQRVPGGPMISTGSPGAWDGEFIVPGNGLVPLGTDRIGITYTASSCPHKYPRDPKVKATFNPSAWATWPRGRLCAVVAKEFGQFATFPIIPTGRRLRLNYRARRGGYVCVGLYQPRIDQAPTTDQRLSNEPSCERSPFRAIEDCDRLWGDQLDRVVTWRGQTDINTRDTQPVELRFHMYNAKVFGFQWD